MKTSIFKRSIAGMLAFAFLLTTMLSVGGTTAFAAGTQEKVYIVSFPRSGDVSSNTGWGHSAQTYLNGWSTTANSYTITRAIGGYEGQACYCIEPGVSQQTGDSLTKKDENFWDNYPDDYNDAISPYTIKLFIGRIMQYGYTGNISTSWRSNNSGADNLCNLIATQLLIWESVIGERDDNFNKLSTGSKNAALDQIATHPLKSKIMSHITDETDFDKLHPRDYPTMRDFYDLLEEEFIRLDDERKSGKIGETVHYTAELVNEVCLALQSMCIGAESKFFNGHSNIRDEQFVCFGVKGLLETNKRLKDTMLFNILSYMSHQLLGKGNTVAAIDEAYLFLSNLTAIEYIRNAMKRVRKKDSAVILASQNVEDFMVESVREFTMPMLSIPDFRFFFYLGKISPQLAVEVLRMEPSEHDLISNSCRGQCLFICGNERHLLMVRAPEHKAALFGKAGGR